MIGTMDVYKPKRINFRSLNEWKDRPVKPIDNMNIQYITVPEHLAGKKRSTEQKDTIENNIRPLFNSVTVTNIQIVKEQLRLVVLSKTHNIDSLKSIAIEILHNFIISEQTIKTYLHLLNAIHGISITVPDEISPLIGVEVVKTKTSKSIGNLFLEECRLLFIKLSLFNNIKTIAAIDTDTIDGMDLYTKQISEISNLLLLFCVLYQQRNTTNIKLTASHLIPVIKTLIDNHNKCREKMKELGDPYEDECEDEDDYELHKKMTSIYARQLYILFNDQGHHFAKDTTSSKSTTLPELIELFKRSVVPFIYESDLIANYNGLKFD